MAKLVTSDRAPGLVVEEGAVIPDDAEIGAHTTIYAGARFGARVRIGHNSVIGRPQEIHGRSRTPRHEPGAETLLADDCRIGSFTILVAGVTLGERAYIGERVTLRETVVVEEDAVVGTGSILSPLTRIGARSRMMGDVMVGPRTTLEADVFVSPRVFFVGDPTMGRRPADASGGILVRRAARIGAAAIVFPEVTIGEESVVGAGSMVRSDVAARTVVAGTPSRVLRPVGDDELLERW
jgi:UDP-2-acetamido-3-amino-2,3-dideoxy-glucuronate N-acetyltransferase